MKKSLIAVAVLAVLAGAAQAFEAAPSTGDVVARAGKGGSDGGNGNGNGSGSGNPNKPVRGGRH